MRRHSCSAAASCRDIGTSPSLFAVEYSDGMSDEWQVVEGTGWISIAGFGRINPRRDNVDGGRQYFTAKTEGDTFAKANGECLSGGPETWHFEFDETFLLADEAGDAVELNISLLEGGRYAVRYRQGQWPSGHTGGW